MKRKSLYNLLPVRFALLVAPLIAAWPQQAQAGSAAWNRDAAANWTAATNWTPNTVPNSITDVATITNDISAARTITLGAAITVNEINLGDSNATHAFTIAPGTGGQLIFGGTSPVLDVRTGLAHVISSPIRFDANTVVRSQTPNGVTLSGGLSDGGAARVISFNNDVDGVARPPASLEGQFAVTTVAAAFNAATTLSVEDVRLNTNFAGALGANATNTITVNGAGQLYLSGATHVNGLVLNSTGWNENVGNLGAVRLESATVSGPVTLQQNTAFGNQANNVGTLSGPISGAFNIEKVGGTTTPGQGVIQFSGDNSAWSGNLTVKRGSVRLNGVNSQGTGSSVVVDGSFVPPGTFTANQLGAQLELAGGVTFGTGKTLTLKSSPAATNNRPTLANQAGSNTWDGPIILDSTEAAGTLCNLTNNTASTVLTINNTISATGPTYPFRLFVRGSSAGVLTAAAVFNMPNTDFAKTDPGTWTINSSGNNWLNTIIAFGGMKLGATDALDSAADLSMGQAGANSTATLDLAGFNQTVGAFRTDLAGTSLTSSILNSGAGPSTLAFTTTGTDTFVGNVAGNTSLVKNGAGTFTLNSSSAATPLMTGTISVNAGAFNLIGTAALGDATAVMNVADGITLGGEGTFGGTLNFGTTTGATLVVDGASATALTVGNLNTNGSIAINTTSGFSPTGTTRLINVPVMPGGAGVAAFSTAGLGLRSAAVSYNATVPAGVDLTYGVATLRWNAAGGPTWDAGVTASWQDSVPTTMTAATGDTLTLDDLPGVNQTIAVSGQVLPGAVIFDNAAVNYTLTAGTNPNIAAPITKQNTGTVAIAYTNPSTQPVTINAGTLSLGAGGADGVLNGPITNNANLVFNYGTGATVAAPMAISGAGAISKIGAGRAVLTGVSTSTGAISITEGILEVDRDTGNLTAVTGIDVGPNGILRYSDDDGDVALDRVVTGSGTVEMNGHSIAASAVSRSLTITSANPSFTGTWLFPTPTTGTQRVNGALPAAYGGGSIVVKSGSQVFAAATTSYPNTITITGTGYADASANLGALRVENTTWAGNVIIDGTARIGSHNVALAAAGKISGSISGGNLEVNVSNYNNSNTTVFTGTNSYGTTTIGGGNTQTAGPPSMRLNIGDGGTSGTLGAGAVTINGDGANGVLGFDRSDGYTLTSGQTITGAGSNITRTFIDFDVQGTGFNDNGNTITLGAAAHGGGGFIRLGQSRADTVTNITGQMTAQKIQLGGVTAGINAVMNIGSGALINTNYFTVGEAASATGGIVNQNGGAVNVVGQLRAGHFGTLTATYNMNGGTLTLTGDSSLNTPSTAGGGTTSTTGDNNINVTDPTAIIGGGIYLGIDGTGIFNHTAGTVTTNWIVLDNRGNTAAGTNMVDGIDRYSISGTALLKLRSQWGIIARNVTTDVSLGGGTIQLDNTGTGGPSGNTGADLDVPIDAALATVAATTTTLDTNGADNSFTLTKALSGSGNLAITGGGTTTVASSSTSPSYAGTVTVNSGNLVMNGTLAGSQVMKTGSMLSGTGTGGGITAESGSTVAPGASVGTLAATSVDLQAGSNYAVEITGAAAADKLAATGALTANGTITVTLTGYTPVLGNTFDIADGTISGTPTFNFAGAGLTAGLAWDTSSFATDGTIKVVVDDPYTAWAASNNVTGGKGGDDDDDGASNLLEFATNSDAKTNGSGARAYGKIHNDILTLTVATRKSAAFAADGVKQKATKDKIVYLVEASNDLAVWNSVVVTELNAVDSAAVQATLSLPMLGADWEWHTFRTDDTITLDNRDFIRLAVSPE